MIHMLRNATRPVAALLTALALFLTGCAGTLEEPLGPIGTPPPKGALILLPFSPGVPVPEDLYSREWTNPTWPRLADGSIQVGSKDNRSRRRFGDARLHLEFRVPVMTGRKGQARGNSGVYIQDRYEVQVLDSYGLEPQDNDCGALYRIAPPAAKACLPPGEWQSYDIDFRAARFDERGKVVAQPRITVRHNGLVIHRDLDLPRPTAGGGRGHVPEGPIRLQDHGDPVRYRNIWVLPGMPRGGGR